MTTTVDHRRSRIIPNTTTTMKKFNHHYSSSVPNSNNDLASWLSTLELSNESNSETEQAWYMACQALRQDPRASEHALSIRQQRHDRFPLSTAGHKLLSLTASHATSCQDVFGLILWLALLCHETGKAEIKAKFKQDKGIMRHSHYRPLPPDDAVFFTAMNDALDASLASTNTVSPPLPPPAYISDFFVAALEREFENERQLRSWAAGVPLPPLKLKEHTSTHVPLRLVENSLEHFLVHAASVSLSICLDVCRGILAETKLGVVAILRAMLSRISLTNDVESGVSETLALAFSTLDFDERTGNGGGDIETRCMQDLQMSPLAQTLIITRFLAHGHDDDALFSRLVCLCGSNLFIPTPTTTQENILLAACAALAPTTSDESLGEGLCEIASTCVKREKLNRERDEAIKSALQCLFLLGLDSTGTRRKYYQNISPWEVAMDAQCIAVIGAGLGDGEAKISAKACQCLGELLGPHSSIKAQVVGNILSGVFLAVDRVPVKSWLTGGVLLGEEHAIQHTWFRHAGAARCLLTVRDELERQVRENAFATAGEGVQAIDVVHDLYELVVSLGHMRKISKGGFPSVRHLERIARYFLNKNESRVVEHFLTWAANALQKSRYSWETGNVYAMLASLRLAAGEQDISHMLDVASEHYRQCGAGDELGVMARLRGNDDMATNTTTRGSPCCVHYVLMGAIDGPDPDLTILRVVCPPNVDAVAQVVRHLESSSQRQVKRGYLTWTASGILSLVELGGDDRSDSGSGSGSKGFWIRRVWPLKSTAMFGEHSPEAFGLLVEGEDGAKLVSVPGGGLSPIVPAASVTCKRYDAMGVAKDMTIPSWFVDRGDEVVLDIRPPIGPPPPPPPPPQPEMIQPPVGPPPPSSPTPLNDDGMASPPPPSPPPPPPVAPPPSQQSIPSTTSTEGTDEAKERIRRKLELKKKAAQAKAAAAVVGNSPSIIIAPTIPVPTASIAPSQPVTTTTETASTHHTLSLEERARRKRESLEMRVAMRGGPRADEEEEEEQPWTVELNPPSPPPPPPPPSSTTNTPRKIILVQDPVNPTPKKKITLLDDEEEVEQQQDNSIPSQSLPVHLPIHVASKAFFSLGGVKVTGEEAAMVNRFLKAQDAVIGASLVSAIRSDPALLVSVKITPDGLTIHAEPSFLELHRFRFGAFSLNQAVGGSENVLELVSNDGATLLLMTDTPYLLRATVGAFATL